MTEVAPSTTICIGDGGVNAAAEEGVAPVGSHRNDLATCNSSCSANSRPRTFTDPHAMSTVSVVSGSVDPGAGSAIWAVSPPIDTSLRPNSVEPGCVDPGSVDAGGGTTSVET